ncbi:hypothetical protein [Corynebacterium sp. HMSC072G08]|nr:hypothetical protein [Corynebacterium sp. HMSC072G08]
MSTSSRLAFSGLVAAAAFGIAAFSSDGSAVASPHDATAEETESPATF